MDGESIQRIQVGYRVYDAMNGSIHGRVISIEEDEVKILLTINRETEILCDLKNETTWSIPLGRVIVDKEE